MFADAFALASTRLPKRDSALLIADEKYIKKKNVKNKTASGIAIKATIVPLFHIMKMLLSGHSASCERFNQTGEQQGDRVAPVVGVVGEGALFGVATA